MTDFLKTYNAVIVLMGINGVLAYSMYAVLVAGQLSLAQAAFASLAAYTSALLTIHAGLPLVVVAVIGIAVGAATALVVGLPVLRLRGVFLAIATLGFGEVVRIMAINLSITGGAQGLRGIPKVVGVPHAWIALAVAAWFFARMRPTRLGLGLTAVREDEIAAEAAGVDTVRYKMYAFIISGAVAGLSGVLSAHFLRFISAGQFGFARALDALEYAIVGGTGMWAGPALGAGFLTVLPEVERQFGFDQAWLRPAISGGILLLVILFLPEGLVGIGGLLRRRDRRPATLGTVTSGAQHLDADATPPKPAEGGEADDAVEVPPPPVVGPDAPALVRVRRLGKDYGGVEALKQVDLEIREGEILGLIGPNGAGKTTLVNVLTGMTPATAGVVEVDQTVLTAETKAHEVAALGVARTFQQVRLFDRMTARQNVMVGGHLAARSTFLPRLVALPSARRAERGAVERADGILDLVGLTGAATVEAANLSYGDRRRLEIARALASEPRLLVLDEPAAGMNHVEAGRLGGLIRTIADQGVTVLLIEHNVRLVMRTCSRVVVLDFGQKIADGPPAEVAADPQVVAAYLGGEDTGLPTPAPGAVDGEPGGDQ